jgi:N-acetylglutamate synthase-like GNAT family acetyltransferase
MPAAKLAEEIDAGVRFWASEIDGEIVGVMGMQPVRDVDLIRHAYVLPTCQRSGLGGALLAHLVRKGDRRVLVGTWAAASWAVRFYQRHGFELVSREETAALLAAYWRISERQAQVSVTLAKAPKTGWSSCEEA